MWDEAVGSVVALYYLPCFLCLLLVKVWELVLHLHVLKLGK